MDNNPNPNQTTPAVPQSAPTPNQPTQPTVVNSETPKPEGEEGKRNWWPWIYAGVAVLILLLTLVYVMINPRQDTSTITQPDEAATINQEFDSLNLDTLDSAFTEVDQDLQNL